MASSLDMLSADCCQLDLLVKTRHRLMIRPWLHLGNADMISQIFSLNVHIVTLSWIYKSAFFGSTFVSHKVSGLNCSLTYTKQNGWPNVDRIGEILAHIGVGHSCSIRAVNLQNVIYSVQNFKVCVLGWSHECNCDILLFHSRCLGVELQGVALHPLHYGRILPQCQARKGAGVFGPVHARTPLAQLHRPWEVVEGQHHGLPLHPGPLQD